MDLGQAGSALAGRHKRAGGTNDRFSMDDIRSIALECYQ